MENDRDTSLQSWEFLTLFLPRCPNFFRCAPRDVATGLYAGSLRELFCSDACRLAYAATAGGASLRDVVFARDGGACAACGADGHALVETLKSLRKAPYGRRYAVALASNPSWARCPHLLEKLLDAPKDGLAWEADHATRVADGGGEATADMVQTLCVPCHRAKTAQEHRDHAARKRRKRGGPQDDPEVADDPPPPPAAAAVLARFAAGDDDDSWM